MPGVKALLKHLWREYYSLVEEWMKDPCDSI
jgi:hypothetical protein